MTVINLRLGPAEPIRLNVDVAPIILRMTGVGAQGVPGPSEITEDTETDLTGVLVGDGANVSATLSPTLTTVITTADATLHGLTVGRGAGNVATNTAVGSGALAANTTGASNVAVGANAANDLTSSSQITAIGEDALSSLTTGDGVVAVGTDAAVFQADGSTPLTGSSNSVYIGVGVLGFDNSDSNTIVIGAGARGEGANTSVLGNTSMSNSHIYGEPTFTHANKSLEFNLGSITSGQTSTVTVPNLDGTMTLLGNTTTGSDNIVLSTSPTLVTPNLGTPSTLVATNATGTASGLTAGNVTTNANLTGPITSVGNATAVASQTGTGSVFAMQEGPTLNSARLNVGVGINAAAPTTGLGKISQTATETNVATNSFGYTQSFTHTSTGANAFSTVGARLQGFVTASGGNYTGQVAGANCNGGVTPEAGITCSQAVGNQGLVSNFGPGTLTEGNCFRTVGATNSGGGSFGTWMGYYASDSSAATTNYGFRGVVSVGANKFNLSMSGTAANYLNGNVGIGTVGIPTGAVLNLIQGGSATLGAATADTVSMANIDNGAGNRELQVQPESGGLFAWGANAYRVVPTANQDFYRKFPTVNTTNNTQTTLFTIPITASRTYLIEARVVARRTGGSAGTADDGAAYVRRATYTTKSGTVTLNTAVETIGTDREDQAAWDVTMTISSTNVLVRVTGDTNNNITWFGDISVQSVGS